jgi:hypothetical protein
MLLKLGYIFLILSFLIGQYANAVLTDFAQPQVKIEKKHYIRKPNKPKEQKIQDAVIYKFPAKKFLGKKITPETEIEIDTEIMQMLIEKAQEKYPENFQIYKNKKKNFEKLQKLTQFISNNTNENILSQYLNQNSSQTRKKEEYSYQEIKKIEKLYQDLKEIYSPNYFNKINDYQKIKDSICQCCGLENFLYIETILKRQINYASYNS